MKSVGPVVNRSLPLSMMAKGATLAKVQAAHLYWCEKGYQDSRSPERLTHPGIATASDKIQSRVF